ncbi:MAG: hypothetical protein ACO2PN_18965 [Pyrobaculum sp.]|jgi:hypothetical protein
MGHVVSPKGWAYFVVNEVDPSSKDGWRVVRLSPVLSLPPARLADVGGQCVVEGEVGVAEVLLGWAKSEPPLPWFELSLGQKRYWVKMAPAYGASAPLSAPAHRLYILCADRKCDLSPLFALADPLKHPQYAAPIIRAHMHAEADGRWMPICDVLDCSKTVFATPSYDNTVGKGALDFLSDPEKLYVLVKLTYDRSKETRRAGYRLGLWSLNPDEMPKHLGETGTFTTVATAALGYIIHMVPKIDKYLRLQPITTL